MPALIFILKMKCPRCHKGDLFIDKNPYNFKMLSKMPAECAVCGQPPTPEPGFYYGAMYASYFICIAMSIMNYFIIEKALNISGAGFLVINSIILLILWPVIFRYARVTYLYLFVRYQPGSGKK
ncbi:MAG: DUF983 domain-containing protein [Cytophagaceae bacterium]|nr:DUF983 domain-containing protein [Cytophagaceae bacterium]